jgi:hypothetical protein
VWTVRNKKLHEGITLSEAEVGNLKLAIELAVKPCL